MSKNAKQTTPSIRSMVVQIMAAGFLSMFVILYLTYYTSMQKLLVERESDNMKSQVQLAESALQSSVNYLPSMTRDWSSSDKTYNYVTGDYDEFQHTLVGDYPFQLFNLNFLTILSIDGETLYERFYDYRSGQFLETKPDLSHLYRRIHPAVISAFLARESDPDNAPPLGRNGFVFNGGQIYYLSAYPIIRSDETGPCVGTFIFGRVIDNHEMEALTENAGISFSIQPIESLPPVLMGDLVHQTNLVVTEKDKVTAYGAMKDIFGNASILLAFDSPRSLYLEGNRFISIILLLLAGCCTVVLFALVKVLSQLVIKPIRGLVDEVNGINMDTLNTDLENRSQNQELQTLTWAINDMLERLRTSRDIIDKNRQELTLHANYDVLTGLYNRQSAKSILESEIASARKQNDCITIFFFDLDRFKFINDTLGHSAGDGFIIALANRLRDNFQSGEILARMGGDEFVVIVRNLREPARRAYVEERITSQFKEPFHVRQEELLAGASVGSSSYPEDGQNAEVLIKNAEIAMFRAKEMGTGLYVPYQRELQTAMRQKSYIENAIRNAINDNCRGFLVYFQPKVDIANRRISGCEALLRWNEGDRIIPPDDFIPQAEENGLILPLSWWLIREACRYAGQFLESGLDFTVSINVSAQVLLHDNFLSVLTGAARAAGIPMSMLDIELVEATLIQDIPKVNGILNALHDLGVIVSVDDFGTGYSSLSYLNKLAVDRIKIDRSFVSRIAVNKEDQAIIHAIVAMARSLEMTITAEGVEDEDQYLFLKNAQCDEVQGFLISRPLPGQDFVRFVKVWEDERIRRLSEETCPSV